MPHRRPEAGASLRNFSQSGNMTVQIHCVYNVHTCQTVKVKSFASPPDADLIGKNINPCLSVTMAREMPLEETSVCKKKNKNK